MSNSDGTKAIKRRVLSKQGMGIKDGLPLQASTGGVDELRKDIQRLMDIEAIKQLKHAYFRCIDTANLEELGTLFHDDVTVHFIGSNYEWKLSSRQEYMEAVKFSFHNESIGHHNGHMPEIQMLSETEATGIWYLADNMWMLSRSHMTTGTALYWDRYEKVEGRWVIKDTRYERLYEIGQSLQSDFKPSSHYLGEYGTVLERK